MQLGCHIPQGAASAGWRAGERGHCSDANGKCPETDSGKIIEGFFVYVTGK